MLTQSKLYGLNNIINYIFVGWSSFKPHYNNDMHRPEETIIASLGCIITSIQPLKSDSSDSTK